MRTLLTVAMGFALLTSPVKADPPNKGNADDSYNQAMDQVDLMDPARDAAQADIGAAQNLEIEVMMAYISGQDGWDNLTAQEQSDFEDAYDAGVIALYGDPGDYENYPGAENLYDDGWEYYEDLGHTCIQVGDEAYMFEDWPAADANYSTATAHFATATGLYGQSESWAESAVEHFEDAMEIFNNAQP